jgi:hypothetical protein
VRQRAITLLVTLFSIFVGCAFVVYVKYFYGSIYAAFAVSRKLIQLLHRPPFELGSVSSLL